VRSSGRQAELVLRVRQGGNESFAFLEAGHRLHAFYCLLRDRDPEGAAAAARGALAGLADYEDEAAEGEAEEAAEAAARAAVPQAAHAPEPPAPETSPPAAPEPPAFSGVPADVASVVEKTVAFVLANGETYEEVIRKKQGGAQLFAFLHPWSPHNAHYRRRLAAAAAERVAAEAAAAAAERVAAEARARDERSQREAPAPAPAPEAEAEEEEEEDAEEEEEEEAEEAARRAERLQRARQFGAQRAAAAVTAASTAHAARLSSHRAALLAFSAEEGDVDVLLPSEEAAPVAPPPLAAAASLFRPRRPSGATSIADARAASLAAAARLRVDIRETE